MCVNDVIADVTCLLKCRIYNFLIYLNCALFGVSACLRVGLFSSLIRGAAPIFRLQLVVRFAQNLIFVRSECQREPMSSVVLQMSAIMGGGIL